MVAESFAPGASVSAAARRHDINPRLLFLWCRRTTRVKVAERRDVDVPLGFVPVAITGCGANCRRAKSRRQLRSRSARFASVSGGRSTGGRCARCLRQSGRLADDRAPT
ncbi:transposase [Bradyrhizobium cosmicum]|uniref:transposase n=1 Tax=Bradyrhizobium cosmicum TaxID=1404864 RepID=UPI0028F14607|nr:transposase [Bradyrhizobium cosmicum]